MKSSERFGWRKLSLAEKARFALSVPIWFLAVVPAGIAIAGWASAYSVMVFADFVGGGAAARLARQLSWTPRIGHPRD